MKICNVCKLEKENSEFSKNKNKTDGLQNRCKLCDKERSKKYYMANKARMTEQLKKTKVERLSKNRKLFFDYLKTCSCIECGIDNPVVLDFDHIDSNEKTHEVSKMVHDGYSWSRIMEEIDKCEVRCSNCHRIKTAKDQEWYKGLL